MKNTIIILAFFLLSTLSKAQDLKLGESFDKWSKDYTLKGISTKTEKHNYQYSKAITRLMFDRKVDVMYVTTKNNIVIGYIYMIIPRDNEAGIPKDLVEQFEKIMKVKLVYSNGTYGVKDDNVVVQFSRNKNPELGGDRIMFYTALVKYL